MKHVINNRYVLSRAPEGLLAPWLDRPGRRPLAGIAGQDVAMQSSTVHQLIDAVGGALRGLAELLRRPVCRVAQPVSAPKWNSNVNAVEPLWLVVKFSNLAVSASASSFEIVPVADFPIPARPVTCLNQRCRKAPAKAFSSPSSRCKRTVPVSRPHCHRETIALTDGREIDHIRILFDYHFIRADSKTGPRAVPLGEAARANIAALPSGRESHAFLFPRYAEGRSQYSLVACWRAVCAGAKLGRLRLHHLRHTAASHAVTSGPIAGAGR